MTTKFAQVKAGLEANVAWRADVAKQEKERWKEVFAKIPAARHRMATILLGDPRAAHMSTAEIITTCNIGHTPEADTQSAQQRLYAAGMTEAARLLGKPAPVTIPEAYPAGSSEFHLDPALYAAGADMAKSLKPFMVAAR
jgi:hypothetical protein